MAGVHDIWMLVGCWKEGEGIELKKNYVEWSMAFCHIICKSMFWLLKIREFRPNQMDHRLKANTIFQGR